MPRRRRSGGARRAAAAALVLHLARGAAGSLFPARLGADAPCSLEGAADGGCALVSRLGAGAKGALRVGLGEAGCTVTLRGCAPGACYSMLDVTTTRVPQDEVRRPAPSSVVKAFEVVRGGATKRFTRDGVAFEAGEDEVVFTYTHTCHDFYAYRGKAPEQLCSEPVDAVTNVDAGLPIGLLCS